MLAPFNAAPKTAHVTTDGVSIANWIYWTLTEL
jgi:hypothetical protein